ncbi:lactonase family protein [Curtobacterium sp. Leaf261]|uniref:lactonase family protein n=1 Tax=Curtobacterium sp. Leaf261 TaxID=1736311 RepID=UPI0006FF8C4C|nr:beta-propeller fold lactonase family protein [Curtobacterium sp. Leaf261]KQO61457.1 hypothetical protein ASF23_13405 [Curtobacterium sp. Leaf261]
MTHSLSDLRLFVGAYTSTSGGHSTGISFIEPRDRTAARDATAFRVSTAAVVDDPSFIVVTDDRLYAVAETESGSVHAFGRAGAALELLWSAPSGGDAPCHLRLDGSGTLVVTNYSSGTVGALASRRPTTTSERTSTTGERTGTAVGRTSTASLPAATGPVLDRQDGPHAHQSVAAPDGDVLVSDLGGDAIHRFHLAEDTDGGRRFEPVTRYPLAPGVGPRHMAWWGDDLIVAGELDGRVHRLRPDGTGALVPVESAATSTPAAEGDDDAIAEAATVTGSTGESYLSHIEVTDAGLVYVAVRGRDTIAVLDATGPLTLVAEVDCGGAWPRHFALVDTDDGPVIVVANERSDALAVLPLGADGLPGAPITQIPVGSPTCVVAI